MERTLLLGLGAIVVLVIAFVTFALTASRARDSKKRIARSKGGPLVPSTEWREQIAHDEPERFARYAEEYITMQKRHLPKEGAGRAVHRKQVLGLQAELEVLADIPEIARHGLFRNAGRYPALIRLSNGAAAKKSNKGPDLRGFAIHVSGVNGLGAMGDGQTDSQDFILLNHSWLPFANVDDFTQFGVKADAGPIVLIGYLIRRYGITGIPGMLASLIALVTKPFKGFAHEPFNSVAPLTCGPYAVRVGLAPRVNNGPAPQKGEDWVEALGARLRNAPLTWDLTVQFYSDELRTPIEDMSVDWPTPYITVATLTVPPQAVNDSAREAQIEAMTFDAWRHALAEHRPLGNVMRARKVAYIANAKWRGAKVD